MQFIDRLILSRGERRLKHFRFENLAIEQRNEISSRYDEFIPLIERCYGDVEYWHGTGRYHYNYTIGARSGEVSKEKYFDVLGSIIENGGMAPHQDVLVVLEGEAVKTISLTACRMYARCYSEIHQYEKTSFQYEYGDLALWSKVIILLQILALLRNSPIKNYFSRLVRIIKNKNTSKHVVAWMSALRSDVGEKLPSLWNLHMFRSDIPTNYGILLGIRKNVIETFSFDHAIERFEARTKNNILLSDLTHIEVPLVMLEKTEDFLKSRNVKLEVIPIEFGERYYNKYSIRELLFSE